MSVDDYSVPASDLDEPKPVDKQVIPSFDDAFDLYEQNQEGGKKSKSTSQHVELTEDDKGRNLFQKLRTLNPKTPKDDYFDEDDNTWDIEGLKEDLQIERKNQKKRKVSLPPRRLPLGIPASFSSSRNSSLEDMEDESDDFDIDMRLGDAHKRKGFMDGERRGLNKRRKSETSGVFVKTVDVHSKRQFRTIMKSRSRELIYRLKLLLQRRLRYRSIPEITEIIQAALNDRDVYEELFPLHKLKQRKSDAWAAKGNKNSGRVLNRIQEISDYLNIPVSDYLDVGAGNGDITVGIGERLGLNASHTNAVDVHDHLAEENQEKCSFLVVPPEEKFPFCEESMDIVTVFMSLHHFQEDNLKLKIAEMSRVLRKGGYIIIREHDCCISGLGMVIDIEHILYDVEVMPWQDAVKSFYAQYRSRDEWDELFEEAGLSLVTHLKVRAQKNPTNFYYAVYTKKDGF